MVNANTYYVNDGSTTGDVYTSATGSDANSGSSSDPFATISFAISQASSGDTIFVDVGTYSETVTVNKAVSIYGPQKDIDPRTAAALRTAGSASEAIVDGGGGSTAIFDITSSGVVLNGLEIRNGSGDLIVSPDDEPAPSKTGVIVKYCLVNTSGDEGIQLRNLDGGGVEYCLVSATTGDGINLSSGCTNSFVSNNEITGSASTNGFIYLYDNGPNMLVDNNLLTGNTGENGIMIGNKGGTNNNSNSSFSNNAIVSNNTVTGHAGSEVGVYINTSRVNVTDNTITGWESAGNAALYLRFNIKDIVVTGNTITGNVKGVKISSGVNAVNTPLISINQNDLSANTAGMSNSSAGVANAQLNWWGNADGPSGSGPGTGTSVSADVDFCPWLDAAPPTGMPTSPTGAVVNTTTMLAYCSIQAAIDDSLTSAGDTLIASAGTYNENIIINKAITLLGAGKTLTILDGISGVGALGTILLPNGADNIQIGAIGQGMHIKGIDNGAPGIENAAVYLQGDHTNITIEGNNIEARGEAGLLGEFGSIIDGVVINANMFTGQTFLGAQPGGIGFGMQFSQANVPRQAITFGNGNNGTKSQNFTFTDNSITAITGGISSDDNTSEQGNTIVTLDLGGNNTISGNNFRGKTRRFGYALRARGAGTYIVQNNRFDGDYVFGLFATNSITAESNYWDSPSGPLNPVNNPCATGKYVTDNVDFEPFFTDSALTTLSPAQPAPVHNASQNTFFCSIQPAIDAANAGDSIYVLAGTYNEDVLINKVITVAGAGAGQSTIVGQKGGNNATVRVSALGVVVDGFTITREGNTVAEWNDATLNSAGIAIQGQTVSGEIRNCELVGNRSAIDVNNSNDNSFHNNVITNNHTGMIFRNQTDNTSLMENQITDNRTVGVLFLDASGGTNSPLQQALNSSFNNNNISGNWYGQIVDRQAGGSLPAPGTTNIKDFECNWYGTTSPVVSSSNSAEPGYASLIPVAYGGTATAPGGQPDILGPGVNNFDYISFLIDGTDNSGDQGFQPVSGSCVGPIPCRDTVYVNDNSLAGDVYTSAVGNDANLGTASAPVLTISHALSLACNGAYIYVDAGVYEDTLTIDSTYYIRGANHGINPNTGIRVAESILYPAVSDPDPFSAGAVSMIYINAGGSGTEIDGLTIDGDNPNLTSSVINNGADVDAIEAISSYEGISNVSVTNNIIKQLSYASIDFYNYNNGGTATTGNLIDGNLFDNILPTSGFGIAVLIYNNCYTTISNNVMTDVRVGVQTGNFYNADPGNSHSIFNNEVESGRIGIWHNLAYTNASTFSIHDNTLTTVPGFPNISQGLKVSSLSGAVGIMLQNNSVDGADIGIDLWNNPTSSTVAVSKNIFTNCDTAIFANNYDGYSSDANSSSYIIDSVDISNAQVGILVKDNSANSNSATVAVTIQNNNSVDSDAGLVVEGGDASAAFSGASPAAFTGQTWYIDQRSNTVNVPTTDINALDVTFDGLTGGMMSTAQAFAAEDKINHKPDYNSLGLVTFVPNNVFITTNSFVAPLTADAQIQRGVDIAAAGDTVNVNSGTYINDLLVNKDNLALLGTGIDQAVIDHSGQPGHNNSGVNITANGVTMQGFTVIDNDGGSVPRYGLKVGTSSVTTDDVTLDSVKVTQSFRTGFDLARPKNITLKNVFAINNGGAGVFMSNPEGASIESITTNGNPWTGVSISSRSDWPGDATDVVFSGTNSFGENGGKNGGVQIESDNTLPITWGNNIADSKDVTIQQGELDFALSGPTTNTFGAIVYAPYFRFFQTLPQAQSAAGIGPDHVDKPRYIQDANCSTIPDTTNFYVFDYVDAATTIQAAIDAAVDGNTVIVDAGTFEENVNVNKVLTVIGVDTTQTIIQGSGGNVVTMAAGSSATNRTTLSQLRVTGGASGIVPSSNNTLHNVLSTGNTTYGVNLGNINDLVITNSCFTHNNVGLKIPSTASVTNLSIDGSEFSYNTQHGWYSDASSAVEPDLDTVSITNTAFNYNGIKGIYTERLSNALLQNVMVQSSGIAANTFASGIDINLKWKDYENIEFDMVTVSGSGIGGSQGTGVTIKGRNDGGTYGANPASLNNLVFTNNNFSSPGIVGSDTLTGVAIGNAITNISFNGTNNFTGNGNGFTNYIDGAAMAPFSLGTSSFDGGLANYINNLSVIDIEALSTTFDGKIGNDMSIAERTSTEDRMLHEPDTSVLGLIFYFDNCADGSCDGCYTAERFNDSVSTGPSQAPGLWYTDRYAPDSFYVAVDSTLVHLIDAADGTNNRPGSFSSAFYNTQGRKYDLDAGITMLSIDLYVPSAWATTGNRMAGVWGTGYDSGNSISAYPIIEFVSDNGDPRFRGYEGDGSWIDMGLPCNFAYDAWHTLRIELLPTGDFRYSVDDLRISTNLHGANGTVELQNIILQGHNSTTGETYQITWDNFINGNGPEINYDANGPDPIVIGSGLSNQHMAVGEFCGLSASLKAHKRFLGDVVPYTGNVVGDTYQFGTGVSPTDGTNSVPDSGTARWNYLVSVNLGTYTFNDLNVYLDIDFDNSDSACQVGPYEADLSAFMIANSMGGSSVFQGSENLGFNFWQTIGDPAILPFDPYAEGTYDLAVRIENKDGVELIHVPIIVEVGCEFVEPSEDLEPPMLVCPMDTTIQAGQSTVPANTGMASVTGICPQNLTYGDDESGLTGCNGTGTIVRTWYNADSTQTCTQNIIVEDTTAPVISVCPADTLLFATGPAGASLVFDAPTATDGFFEGFENAVPPAEAWNAYNNNVVRVANGTDGILSKAGAYHANIDPSDAAQTGAFTRLGGYSSSFGSGFTASQDIYIDLSDSTVANNTYGWDLSMAANNQSNSHLRDFVFHAASNASGNVFIAGSNNTNFTRRNDLGSLNNYEITNSGWYTFEWVFRDSAGSLAVDLNLKDGNGTHLFTETRYTLADDIATVVGGNRYMWFTFLETSDLRIDNTTLNRDASVVCSASSGDTFPFGVTTVTCVTTDACGNADSCSFNVTVVDTAGALNFDGLNDVVSVPHDASLSGYGTALTVEAWIRPEKVTGRQGIVGKWNDLSGTNRRSMLLWANDDDVQFYVSSTGSNFPNVVATNKLTIGEWTHVAGTYDGQTIRVYINGVLSASTAFSGTLFNNTVDPLLIGAVDGGGTSRQHFDGDIDEVRVYNRVLCADEIVAHLNCELSGSEIGLGAYYNFNQGIAGGDNTGLDTLIDSSPNNNTGDLQNFALNGFASNWMLQTDSVSGACAPHLSPMLTVYGNNVAIADGDLTAGVADSTDFGIVTVGESNENCFYLVNTGTGVLNVSSVTISGANSAQFSTPAYSGAVLPGDSVLVCVAYSPSVAALHNANLEVSSDDCQATTYNFSLKGEGFEQTCDTIRFISDTTWRMSTTVTPSNFSGNWSGVNGVLPASSTYTNPVMIGQPYNFSYQTLFAVDTAEIIKSGNNITYFRKTIMLDTLVDVGANLRATFDDQIEIYVNGKLLAAHYNFSNQNSKLPPFDVMFNGDGSVVNGSGGNKAFGFTTADTLENVFQPGVNDIVVVLRNLATSHDAGGFSLTMQVDGCEGVIEPDTTTPVDAVCDTVGIIASTKWRMSTTVTPSTFNGSWSGVSGALPDTSTFTQPVTIGQPFSYQTIFPVDSSSVIRAENNIRYYHRRMILDSLVDIGALLKATFDDQMEVYVNGILLGGHYGFSNQNSKLPPFESTYVNGGGVNNGTSGNKPFDYTTPDTLDNIFKPGINDVIVVLRNRANTGELGGFSINLVVNGCEGEVEVDTNVVPEDTLTTSIVSDNGWEKSTQTEASNLSGNWSGASALPPTHTYTLPAVEGQPYGYVTIDPIDSAKVIKTENNITFFRKTFELTDNVGLDARFRSNVDDGLEIYINGKLVTRDEDFGNINFRNPNHDLKFFGGTSPINGFSGGDFYNFVTAGNLDTFFVTGTNEVVVAVRNKSKSTDMGGFSFRMDIDKGGNKVIVKAADATSGADVVSSILDFELYPNPTTGLVNVVMLGKVVSDDNEIIVQDVSGRVITKGSFESFAGDGGMQIDMSDFASGVYLIRVKSGDTYRSKRVMKN